MRFSAIDKCEEQSFEVVFGSVGRREASMATTGRTDPKARLSPLWPCFRSAPYRAGRVCHACRSRQVLEAIELHRRSGSNLRRRRWARGQAIVEFAMVAPLFFALIFGLIEFSLIGIS